MLKARKGSGHVCLSFPEHEEQPSMPGMSMHMEPTTRCAACAVGSMVDVTTELQRSLVSSRVVMRVPEEHKDVKLDTMGEEHWLLSGDSLHAVRRSVNGSHWVFEVVFLHSWDSVHAEGHPDGVPLRVQRVSRSALSCCCCAIDTVHDGIVTVDSAKHSAP